MRVRVGYLASGAASSARAIHDAVARGDIDAVGAVLIGNNSSSGAIDWAAQEGISAHHLSGKTHPSPSMLDEAIRDTLLAHTPDLIVLSGYARRSARSRSRPSRAGC